MEKLEVLYRCPICKRVHEFEQVAQFCLDKGIEDAGIKVGDIVEATYGYGWFDGDKRWVINPDVDRSKHGFSKDRSMGFYYVVTAIDNDGHRVRYHLATNAMTGKDGHKGGKTYSSGHKTPTKIENPPAFVVEDSKVLIGVTFENLL